MATRHHHGRHHHHKKRDADSSSNHDDHGHDEHEHEERAHGGVIEYLDLDAVDADACARLFPQSETLEGGTVHVKGFGRQVDYDNETIAKERLRLLDAVSGAHTVVWDGDSLQSDSFSALIPQIKPPPAHYVAFLKRKEQPRFQKSWTNFATVARARKGSFICILCDDVQSYEHLGNLALLKTQAKHVHVFGVGQVVEREIAMAPSGVDFVCYDVHR